MYFAAMALNGHANALSRCPLSGVKRTLRGDAPMSAFDPMRTFAPLSVHANFALHITAGTNIIDGGKQALRNFAPGHG